MRDTDYMLDAPRGWFDDEALEPEIEEAEFHASRAVAGHDKGHHQRPAPEQLDLFAGVSDADDINF